MNITALVVVKNVTFCTLNIVASQRNGSETRTIGGTHEKDCDPSDHRKTDRIKIHILLATVKVGIDLIFNYSLLSKLINKTTWTNLKRVKSYSVALGVACSVNVVLNNKWKQEEPGVVRMLDSSSLYKV